VERTKTLSSRATMTTAPRSMRPCESGCSTPVSSVLSVDLYELSCNAWYFMDTACSPADSSLSLRCSLMQKLWSFRHVLITLRTLTKSTTRGRLEICHLFTSNPKAISIRILNWLK
jgi:hypothetical protein